MNKFYTVHCDDSDNRDRDEIAHCKTRKKAVELAINFLLESSASQNIMMYILWDNPIYDVNDQNDRNRFIDDVTKHFKNNNSIVGFGNKGTDAYVDSTEYGDVYITCEEFEEI